MVTGITRDERELAAGLTALVVFGRLARRLTVGAAEARIFRTVNDLPTELYAPVWPVMQMGSLGGVFAAAGVAAAGGRRRLAVQLLGAGSFTWGTAKLLKHFVQRGRPADTVDRYRVLGRSQTGLGYPSGHAAVAATLAGLTAPHIPARWRVPFWGVAGTTGAARIFVGAHLPLDVAGGVALGVAVSAATRLVTRNLTNAPGLG